MQIDSKQAVARAAAALIQPGQVVIVDGGTTTAAMIGFLPADLSCTVVTHSLASPWRWWTIRESR